MAWQVAVPAAVAAAGCMAVASALQHRSARATPDARGLGARQLARFARVLVGQRWWQVAVPVQLVGLVLHAVALGYGSLATVQPVLVTSLVFALALNRLLGGEPVTRGELGWAVTAMAGLAGFLGTAGVAPASRLAAGRMWVLVLAMIGVVGVVACCLSVARRTRPGPAAALLGVGAGVAYAAQALFLQATTRAVAVGPAGLVGSGAFYGLLVCGGGGFALTQLAFRAGPLVASLPAITATNPLGGVLLGGLVNGEEIRGGPLALTVEALALLVLTVAAVALGRNPRRVGEPLGQRARH